MNNIRFITLAIFLVLIGCTSQEYKESIKVGKEALGVQEYEKAIQVLSKATEQEPNEKEAKDLLAQAKEARMESIKAKVTNAINEYEGLFKSQEWDKSIQTIAEVQKVVIEDEALKKEAEQLEKLLKNSKSAKEVDTGKKLLQDKNFDEALKHFENAQNLAGSDEAKSLISDTLKRKAENEEAQKKLEFAKKKNVFKFDISDAGKKTSYELYIYAESEKIKINDYTWACAMKGDRIYSGNYSAALVKKGTTDVHFFDLGERQFNYDGKEVFIVKGNPDLLAFSSCQASSGSLINYWFVKEGQLKVIKNEKGNDGFGIFRGYIKSAGEGSYQSVSYTNSSDEVSWIFENWTLDQNKEILIHEKELTFTNQRFTEGQKQLNRFYNEKDYIVEK
ncbi:hypothetical protein M5X11_07890 [Paenibacillus alginolyticus]|uniref:hypothetical protein n=1 Tax=Paenibacillus alginolyticus TaxID=59839 RepID=UPI0003FDE901|nr:hypothetical protein [Paenibacillus alginolyticus]MCY9664877.1 hypothetical protein [Paenibacillus alginolyticus]